MNQSLIDYIKKSKEAGLGDEQIKQALFEAGWQGSDISEAFKILQLSQQNLNQPQMKNTGVLPGATALFSEAWEIYKKRFGTFIGIMAIPASIINFDCHNCCCLYLFKRC